MSQILPLRCFTIHSTTIQRDTRGRNIQNNYGRSLKIRSWEPREKREAGGTMGHPWRTLHFAFLWQARQHGPGSCVFPHTFLVNVIKALTPSCLALELVLGLLKTRWLFLSSFLSKLNNHEEENITCGKSTPFSFASYYPNSSLILYHCYPPTNDRVQAILSLTTSLPKTHNRSCYAFPDYHMVLTRVKLILTSDPSTSWTMT